MYKRQALDYLKSKERNVNLGQKDSTRSWQPNVSITLADNTIYPVSYTHLRKDYIVLYEEMNSTDKKQTDFIYMLKV